MYEAIDAAGFDSNEMGDQTKYFKLATLLMIELLRYYLMTELAMAWPKNQGRIF